ncbi:MAG: hypothetical protein ACI8YQ_003706 [Polaribacter sp.]|jgi:hypothetical protein
MKNILFLSLLICFCSSTVQAQSNSIESFYEQYAKNEKVTNVTIKGWLLDIASHITSDESSKEVLSKITQLRILLMEDGNPVTKNELSRLKKGIKKDHFEELLQIRDEGSHVDFYIREEGDHITNVLMLVNDNDEFVLLSLEGLLKLEDLKNIKIDTDGAEHFEKIKRKEVPRA